MIHYTKFNCSNCGTVRYSAKGSVDFFCHCVKSNGEIKTDDRIRINMNDPQWNTLGINSDFDKKSDTQKRDQIFEKNTPVVTCNSV